MIRSLVEGSCPAPFDVLGIHPLAGSDGRGRVVRAFIPWAKSVAVLGPDGRKPMERVAEDGLFQAVFPASEEFFAYRLRVEDPEGRTWEVEDPYRFPPAVDEARVRRFLVGEERRVHEVLGAQPTELEAVAGTVFAVWAPHARAVNLMGDMNGWDGRCHPMRPRGETGVWELFVPGVGVGARYKYEVVRADGVRWDKADPCGRAAELRPAFGSQVWDPSLYAWGDAEWLERRRGWHADDEPMSVYEVHLGSWRRRHGRGPGGVPGWLTYRELADELVPYVKGLGFTHVELLPVVEHPLDESWGYQPLGFFAPTARHGSPDDFRYLVDRAHQAGLGVILDWVPGHFPEDAHGLVQFDGTPLYEHPDPRQARHPDWGSLVFDFGKPAVRSYLMSSALHWLEDYHVDGLRVDAVASMLYLDYSRAHGEWTPNPFGGRENLEAVSFLTEFNDVVHQEVPGAVTIAEESTAWPRVSHGTDRGGLGFDQKWNMGWMNDTLQVMEADPVYRRWKYERLTFSQLYAYSERFMLPLSHDEVVHGKRSLVSKMPGLREDKLSNLRLLLAYQWAHPGKKLLFMGCELAQWTEWDEGGEVDWALQEHAGHAGVQRLVGTLNRLYHEHDALHQLDFRAEGFEWLDCQDEGRTTLSFLRWSREWRDFVAVVLNFTPVYRGDFHLAVPHPGRYRVILDTDAKEFGGWGARHGEWVDSTPGRLHGRDHYVVVPLPGLAALYLVKAEGA